MSRKAVVLLSGGLDSTTVLAVAKDQGFEPYAISFRYGQRHAVELDAARRVANAAGVERHVVCDIDLRVFGGSALTADVDVPKHESADELSDDEIPVTYVPARNTVFLSRAFKLDMSTRDLQAPQQAYNDFNIVATRYPNSRYDADARQRMLFLRNEFARFELNTGLYYLQRGAWVSAADRATYLLETYPQTAYQNDAVALLGEAYTRMGNPTLAADARRVLQQNDPQHPWLAGNWPKGKGIIARLNPLNGN